jgi:hypothetical protein
MTEECGFGIRKVFFNGHFKPTEADKINRIGQLRQGVVRWKPKILSDVARKYTIADMITGYGVAKLFVITILFMAVMLKVKKQSFKDLVT